MCYKINDTIIGELAPLLSVLGHQMHKRHKTATIWMHVAVLFHYYALKAGIWRAIHYWWEPHWHILLNLCINRQPIRAGQDCPQGH
jgi:hypothetical protein